jgi:hypothetical protein
MDWKEMIVWLGVTAAAAFCGLQMRECDSNRTYEETHKHIRCMKTEAAKACPCICK